MPACKGDARRYYKGDEPSPKGRGYCAHTLDAGTRMKGTDGRLWEVRLDSANRKAWRLAKSVAAAKPLRPAPVVAPAPVVVPVAPVVVPAAPVVVALARPAPGKALSPRALIVQRLKELSVGGGQWRVQNPDGVAEARVFAQGGNKLHRVTVMGISSRSPIRKTLSEGRGFAKEGPNHYSASLTPREAADLLYQLFKQKWTTVLPAGAAVAPVAVVAPALTFNGEEWSDGSSLSWVNISFPAADAERVIDLGGGKYKTVALTPQYLEALVLPDLLRGNGIEIEFDERFSIPVAGPVTIGKLMNKVSAVLNKEIPEKERAFYKAKRGAAYEGLLGDHVFFQGLTSRGKAPEGRYRFGINLGS